VNVTVLVWKQYNFSCEDYFERCPIFCTQCNKYRKCQYCTHPKSYSLYRWCEHCMQLINRKPNIE